MKYITIIKTQFCHLGHNPFSLETKLFSAVAVAEQQILDESAEGESSDIHQKLYDLATANWNTVAEAQAQYQGGSENFHEGPGGWNSGNGFSRVTG